jgi:hypothetical protein
LHSATDEGATDETFARAAWINAGAMSRRAFITAFPTPEARTTHHRRAATAPTSSALSAAIAMYFGKRILVLEGIAGREIASRKGRKCDNVDPFGSRLFCATLGDSTRSPTTNHRAPKFYFQNKSGPLPRIWTSTTDTLIRTYSELAFENFAHHTHHKPTFGIPAKKTKAALTARTWHYVLPPRSLVQNAPPFFCVSGSGLFEAVLWSK